MEEGMIDSERVQKAARELIDYARTFLSTAYPNRTRELVDALDAALTADAQPVGDAPNVGDDCCPECHCLKSAHHGPRIGCEGSGGNCGCPDTFPPPHPAAPEPLVYKDACQHLTASPRINIDGATGLHCIVCGAFVAFAEGSLHSWEQIEAALKPAYITTFDTEMQYDQMLRNLHKLLTARERVTVERKICTSFVNPPIPIRAFDWQAWVDGQEEAGPYGSGRTEQEAISDLREQLEEK
jgi:hypothetical protein